MSYTFWECESAGVKMCVQYEYACIERPGDYIKSSRKPK